MALTDRYKYAVRANGDGFMLFDLENDPDELRNLLGHPDYRAIATDMRDRLFRFLCKMQCAL